MKDMFEYEISRENMEVDLEDLNKALSPEEFDGLVSLPDKVY